jgi:hypothetical protein
MEYRARATYVSGVVMHVAQNPTSRKRPESIAEREVRIQSETDSIARAHADIDAGLGIEDEDMEAWLDSLERDQHAPVPVSNRQKLRG